MSAINRKAAFTSLLWTATSSVSATVSQLVLFFVLAHQLGPEKMGLAAVTLVLTNVVLAWSDLGLSAAIVRERDVSNQQLSSLYWITLIAGATLCASQWLLSGVIAEVLGDSRMVPLIQFAAFVFPLASVGAPYQAILQRELQFRRLSSVETLASVAGAVLGIVAAVNAYGPVSLVLACLFTHAVKSSALVVLGWNRWRPSMTIALRGTRSLLRFGFFQLCDRTLSSVNFYVDQVLTSSLLGIQKAGYYSFASNLAIIPVYRINAIANRAAFPLLCRTQDQPEKIRRGYLELLRLVSFINFPLLLGLAAIAPFVVPLLFGSEWAPAVIIVQLLAFAALARAICNPISVLLQAKGRADLGFGWNLSISGFCVLMTWVGAALWGIIGVAAAQCFTYLALAVLLYFIVVRRVLGKCGRAYSASVLPALVAAVIMAICEWIFQLCLPAETVLGVRMVGIAVGAVVYGIAIWCLAPRYRADLVELLTWARIRPSV